MTSKNLNLAPQANPTQYFSVKSLAKATFFTMLRANMAVLFKVMSFKPLLV